MPKPLVDIEMLEDARGFSEEISRQNDLTAALLCAANLSSRLAQLITSFLIDDKKLIREFMHPDEANAPLSAFGGRITGAYCMGLIDKRTLKELRWIKKVRNKFAHGMHGVTFEDQEIVKWCSKLTLPDDLSKLTSGKYDASAARTRYTLSSFLLISHIGRKSAHPNKDKRTALNDLVFTATNTRSGNSKVVRIDFQQ